MSVVRINVKDFVKDDLSAVDIARNVAVEVTRVLRDGGSVNISMDGVRGAPSSFFNVLLQAATEVLKDDFSEKRFVVETTSATQRLVYERSLKARKAS